MRSGGAGQKINEGSAADWRGPDADAMDDAECARYVEGKLTARGSGAGRDFQGRSPAETIRSLAWVLLGQARGVMWTDQRPRAASGREWQ